jgi:hypothetical protein
VKLCTIHDDQISDHNPVNLELEIVNKTKWGQGLWKLNNSHLVNKNYQETIRIYINRLKSTTTGDIMKDWENLKKEFKKLTKYFSKIERGKKTMASKNIFGNPT